MKSFNDVLTKKVEHNLNILYDGTFQTEIRNVSRRLKLQWAHKWKLIWILIKTILLFQDKAAHFELLEKSDFIFYNVTDGLKAMDNIRLKIYDPKMPINIEKVPTR